MKRLSILILLFIITIGCSNSKKGETEEEIIKKEHSDLYIEGLSVDYVILYFNEVVLGAEYINSGDPYKIQKWQTPIYYLIEGTYTDEDIKTLKRFTEWLNTIDNFPGIYEADNESKVNLFIHFCSEEKMVNLLGTNFTNMDAGVTFWYTDDIINREIICYRTDLSQEVRNSAIIEEIYNGLGPINDTKLREDSIIYSEFSTPQNLTKVDEIILKLLYNPKIKPGMTSEEYEKIIRELYY